ncbi:MAG: hypothetical protein WAO00_11670 [Chthoniobacterales bacterium]
MTEGVFLQMKTYCEQQGVGIAARNQAFCYFMQAYIAEIQKHTDAGARPDEKTQDLIASTLLTPEAIEGYIIKAQKALSDAEAVLLQKFSAIRPPANFWSSVFASLLASFLYSVLLLVVYLIIKAHVSGLPDLINASQKANGG